MTTADNTTTETEEMKSTELGSGGLASIPVIGTLDQLVDVIVDKRESLVNANQKNVEVFNQLQQITAKIQTNLTVLDGAIAGISEFVNEETDESDEHILRLKELHTNRIKSLEELKLVNSKRTLLITSIHASEIALKMLNEILTRAGSEDINSTDLSLLKTEEQSKEELKENS